MEIDPRLDSLMTFSEVKKRKFVELFQTFLWNILSYLIEYLPFSDSIINSLDFVLLDNSLFVLKEKILTFDEIFGITSKDNKIELCEEINTLISTNINWMRIESRNSSLHLWDLIEFANDRNQNGDNEYKHLTKIFRLAHILPTSSACIEQSFSSLKFIKNLLRNSLREETVQSLIIIAQEFKDKDIIISEEMLHRYNSVKESLNKRKSILTVKEIPLENIAEETASSNPNMGFDELNEHPNKRKEFEGKYAKGQVIWKIFSKLKDSKAEFRNR